MATLANKRLVTSLGVIAPGEEIPAKLPSKERDKIRKAGGFVAGATKPSAKDIEAAKRAVVDAEAHLKSAQTDEAKATAQELLDAAHAALADLQAA